jgi:hypothetical protein
MQARDGLVSVYLVKASTLILLGNYMHVMFLATLILLKPPIRLIRELHKKLVFHKK